MSRWKLQFIGGTRKDNVELLNTLEDARRSGNRRLKKVFLETSTKCKADCKHCYYRNNKNLKEFTLDEICDIQDYLGDFGVRAITYAGADAIFRTDHNIILKRGKDKALRSLAISAGLTNPKTVTPSRFSRFSMAAASTKASNPRAVVARVRVASLNAP